MVIEEVTMKLTECISLLDEEIEKITNESAKKEEELKKEKLKAVEAIKTSFEAYKDDVRDEAWEKLNALRNMYEGLRVKEAKYEEVEKEQIKATIKDLENKKAAILKSLKTFGNINMDVKLDEEPAKEEEKEEINTKPVEEKKEEVKVEPKIEVKEEKKEEPVKEAVPGIKEATVQSIEMPAIKETDN